ncbi:MAG TPA: DMT family transporter [Azospirillaceae bacterium]|nr:DMT family transporter [Azospirillaceae bacterium]
MRTAYLQLALSMILVGLTVPASKVVVEWMPPLVAAMLRFALAAAVLAPLAIRSRGRGLPTSVRDWVSLTLLALFGMVLFNVFLLYGLRATSAVSAGIVTSTIPAMTALCAALILGERMSAKGVAGIGLAVLGIGALNLGTGLGPGADTGDTLVGNALVFGAVVSEALYGVFARRLGGRVAPLALAFAANLLSTLMIAPFALAALDGFAAGPVPVWVWALFVTSGLGSLVAVVLWMRGVVLVEASRAGLFTGLIPAAGVAAAVMALGEPFTPIHAAGMVAVLLGLFLGTRATSGRSAVSPAPAPASD